MALRLANITCSFGATRALHDVSLNIEAGEQVALIGPSGSGKTTLIRLIGTQIAPQAGELDILRSTPAILTPSGIKKLRTQIAMVPQHLGLVPNVTVLRNVLNGGLGKINLAQSLRQTIFPFKKEIRHVFDLLERTGIGEKIYDRTDSLSGGQQQRVAIARALYQKPAILLADEPLSAIDPARARDMLSLLTKLSKEENITLIVSLHNLELAREFFPRLIGLRQGEILFDAAPDELQENDCATLYHLEENIPLHGTAK